MALNLFVYGTLMFPVVMTRITGIRVPAIEARLPGYARYTLADREQARVPVIVAEAGACVQGRLLCGLDSDVVETLDRFEEIGSGRYRRITVVVQSVDGEWRMAEVYAAGEQALSHLAGPWQPDQFERHELERYLSRLSGTGA
ncbi:MAG: gamma-glutamylcyclotransferase [Sedimenticola sp.]|nr:gamma-glutamylcyclotransferase [Sedimenticola sp.]